MPVHGVGAIPIQATPASKEWADGRKRASYDEEANEVVEIRARGKSRPLKSRKRTAEEEDISVAGMSSDELWAQAAERKAVKARLDEQESGEPMSMPETVTDDEFIGSNSDFDVADIEAIN